MEYNNIAKSLVFLEKIKDMYSKLEVLDYMTFNFMNRYIKWRLYIYKELNNQQA